MVPQHRGNPSVHRPPCREVAVEPPGAWVVSVVLGPCMGVCCRVVVVAVVEGLLYGVTCGA